jgi:hypothetical protein
MESSPLVQIATAYSHRSDFHERIVRADLRDIDFPEFDGHRFLGKVDNSRLLVHRFY